MSSVVYEPSTNTSVVVMNEIPDGADMIGELFGKRQCLPNETTTALAKSIVEPFNQTGFATGFINGSMTLGGQNAVVGLQEVRVTNGTLPILRWKGIPQILRRFLVSRANRTPDNQTCFGIHGKP